jgi:hypothetical protein
LNGKNKENNSLELACRKIRNMGKLPPIKGLIEWDN